MKRKTLPYRAELHGIGGVLAVLEHARLDYIKKVIAAEWVPYLTDGDTIRITYQGED